jgi:quercetin dioxygenase-like cupin family protein
MTELNTIARPPGATVAYLLRGGEGVSHLVAGQVIRTLAGVEETAGGFGAVVCECPRDRGPIPMHWHQREHDTWFCTRGKLQVWCGDESRVLAPGDFAYVMPGDTHSYQSVAPRTQFFGIVAPGGWEQFFADAGEVWGMTGLPPADRPFDFSRMGPAMAKHRIMRVENATYAQAAAIGEADQTLPEGHASYFLEAGFGRRRVLRGHLSTAVLTKDQSKGFVDMRVIEAGRGATMPTLHHVKTHTFLYVVEGALSVEIDGKAHTLVAGDSANIPAGTPYATGVTSGTARWLLSTANGNGAALWDAGGEETPGFLFPLQTDTAAEEARLKALDGVDVVFG